MNQLNYGPLGGVKLDQDDLEFYHNAIKQGFEGVCDLLGETWRTGAILANGSGGGFDIALSWTKGFLWYNGEFYYIAAGGPINLSSSGDDEVYIKLLEGFDPDGSELNKVGATIEQYIYRVATIAVAPVGTASLLTGYVGLYNNILSTDWRSITLDTGYENVSGDEVAVRREFNGVVRLKGRFKLTSVSPTGGFIVVLANYLRPEYRPTNNVKAIVVNENANQPILLTVFTNGSIFLSALSGGTLATNNVIALDGVTWSKT
jgi:hypothetical protein